MPLNVWLAQSGQSLGTIEERSRVSIALPVSYANGFNDSTNLNFRVISGSLPPGLFIQEDRIEGAAFEVPRTTDFKFVIRAQYGDLISDRTFKFTVVGSDIPNWITPSGSLAPINTGQYYVLDSSYIDFQLEAIDYDTTAGQELKFFKKSGLLPPGLILTESGRLVGWVQPALAIPETAGKGTYDSSLYDIVAYDFGQRSSNGYDTFIFDSTIFDYSYPDNPPKKLNRYYEFIVTVTDGDTAVDRKFKIFVVGDDYFRADTTVTYAGSGTFTVDTTYLRAPIWLTSPNLGIKRASNYQTFKLDLYDDLNLGIVLYEFDLVNPRVSGIAFTNLSTENKITRNLVRIKNTDGVPRTSDYLYLKNYVTNATSQVFDIVNVTTVSSTEYILTINPSLPVVIPNNTGLSVGSLSILPPGMQFDPGSAEVFGVVPYQPAVTKSYSFTIIASRVSEKYEIIRSRRTFNVQIIGEIDSVINWITESNLGSIQANLISNLYVKAETSLSNPVLLYVLKSGSLPPGLTLNLDGEIVGKVPQFQINNQPGLITIDQGDFLLDQGTTTLDKSYKFTVEVRDITNYSAITREFYVKIETPNNELYSNITVKPFLKLDQRSTFQDFITDSDIFTIDNIYRPNDSNFGIQRDLKMLVFAGIETRSAAQVVGVINRNHSTKRFLFGSVKRAVAKVLGTETVIYEVIYIEMIDPLEFNGRYLPATISTSPSKTLITVDQNNQYDIGPFNLDTKFWNRPIPFYASVDRTDLFANDPETEIKLPSSITNWRKRIRELGLRDRNYLPLWMRSIQENTVKELDYVPAVVLCYCKPGKGKDILLNIQNRNFDFSQLDYVVDRYIIDSVTGYNADKYIVFKNDRTTIS